MPDLRVSFPRPCDEPWEKMAPAGCDRICARCDTVIHDLSQLDVDQAEALLRGDAKACVRATIGADGAVLLKPDRGGAVRRMVMVAATAGLLAACAPESGQQGAGGGAIAGEVEPGERVVQATATHADGRRFTAKVAPDGRYLIAGLPPGTYTVIFDAAQGPGWMVPNVVVDKGETRLPKSPDPGPYMLGQMLIENEAGPA